MSLWQICLYFIFYLDLIFILPKLRCKVYWVHWVAHARVVARRCKWGVIRNFFQHVSVSVTLSWQAQYLGASPACAAHCKWPLLAYMPRMKERYSQCARQASVAVQKMRACDEEGFSGLILSHFSGGMAAAVWWQLASVRLGRGARSSGIASAGKRPLRQLPGTLVSGFVPGCGQ